MLGFIKRRASEFNNVRVSKTLYCSFVRPILEYCCFIWMPHQTIFIREIESIQKQFLIFALRHIYDPRDYKNFPNYHYRLKVLELKTLEERRELLSSCFIFDIVKRNINIKYFNDRVLPNNDVRQTRHTKFLKEIQHRTDYGKNEPINRGIVLFNNYFDCFNSEYSKLTYKKNIIKIIS